jgi:hypothetical protein
MRVWLRYLGLYNLFGGSSALIQNTELRDIISLCFSIDQYFDTFITSIMIDNLSVALLWTWSKLIGTMEMRHTVL